jgi:hypothetical protein
MKPEVDVAELFLCTGGPWVKFSRRPQITKRGRQRFRQVAAPLVSLAPLQIGEHRPALQGDRAAEVFDGHKGLSVAKRLVTLEDEPLIFAVPFHGLVSHDGRHGQTGQDEDSGNNFFHAPGDNIPW